MPFALTSSMSRHSATWCTIARARDRRYEQDPAWPAQCGAVAANVSPEMLVERISLLTTACAREQRRPVERLGEDALLLRLGEASNSISMPGFTAWRHASPRGAILAADIVPATPRCAVHRYGSVAERWIRRPGRSVAAAQISRRRRRMARSDGLHTIAVHYCGIDGPDLEAVSEHAGLSAAAVVAPTPPSIPVAMSVSPLVFLSDRHGRSWRWRATTPRVPRSPPAASASAARRTGLPESRTRGWRVIGRTEVALFDPCANRRIACARRSRALRRRYRNMSVRVLAPGLLSTVQDGGRHGYRHFGVAGAGALDPYSFAIANRLVGNAALSPALEITLSGPRLHFDRAARIALCGADIDARVDGSAIPGWRCIDLPAASELVLGHCRRGARAYLAIAGGFAVPRLLGSASTDLRAAFGGVRGRMLAAGDILAVARARHRTPKLCDRPILDRSRAGSDFSQPTSVIRMMPGQTTLADAAVLFAREWQVDPASNRQGLRLQGAALTLADRRERVSEPVMPGTLQLPPDGNPILLLADAQTHGGYPRIGHAISADRPRLAQLKPGDRLRFVACTSAQARRLSIEPAAKWCASPGDRGRAARSLIRSGGLGRWSRS